ncbi:MAG: hypothetical protein P4L36_12570 [Holophaga sp.]|nr:hypothetical protein [Holophaga sp.]
MHKIFIILAAALFFGAGYGDEPLYQGAPHRFDAAIQVNDITRYSINLLWINRTLDPTQPYLSSAREEEAMVAQLLTPAVKWAVANPKADVNLWYDGVMATRDAVAATHAVLDRLLHHDGIANLRLRDVRDIPIVKNNPDAFSDQTPIYFRVDILKPILIVNAIENEHNQAAVFADMEVGDLRPDHLRMNKAELFDATTMRQLSSEGLLLNRSGGYAENQFIQMLNDERMIKAIKLAVINLNLMRACTALNGKQIDFIASLGGAVYSSTCTDLFNFYKGTAAGVSIKFRLDRAKLESKTDTWIDYDPKIHGYAPFGLYFNEREGRPMAMEDDGTFIYQDKMIKFPFKRVYVISAPVRDVQVRPGHGHSTDGTQLVQRAPAGGGSVYHCELWD